MCIYVYIICPYTRVCRVRIRVRYANIKQIPIRCRSIGISKTQNRCRKSRKFCMSACSFRDLFPECFTENRGEKKNTNERSGHGELIYANTYTRTARGYNIWPWKWTASIRVGQAFCLRERMNIKLYTYILSLLKSFCYRSNWFISQSLMRCVVGEEGGVLTKSILQSTINCPAPSLHVYRYGENG